MDTLNNVITVAWALRTHIVIVAGILAVVTVLEAARSRRYAHLKAGR